MSMNAPRLKETVFRMVSEKKLSAAQAVSLVAALGEAQEATASDSPPSIRSASIAVIGLSGRFPGAENAEELWENLAQGRCAVAPAPAERWPSISFGKNANHGGFLPRIDEFDPLFFNISPKEAEVMDPQQRIFLEEAWAAIENAGYSGGRLDGARCGVFVGVGSGDYSQKLAAEGIVADGAAFMGNANSILTARIAYLLNLKGPCLAVDTACSSSLVALHLACESLRSGACDVALGGGVCILNTPNFLLAGGAAGMLAPGGLCRTFDAAADGFVPAEAAGALLLKPLADALKHGDFIYGVIEGSAINQDGKTNGITAPSAPSQTALELEVYRLANIQPESIGYVEAHGTGTPLGDPIEVEALTEAFQRTTQRKEFCALGSIKTNIGHAMSAAGVVSVIKVLLALQHRQIPPSLHFSNENPALDLASSPFFVNTSLRDWPAPAPREPRRAAVSAFGFSGTNAHMVIAEAPAARASTAASRPVDAVLSAKTPSALRKRCEQLSAWLNGHPDFADISALAATLACGRSHFEYRIAFTAATIAQLQQQLSQSYCDRPSDTATRYVQGGTINWNAAFPEAGRRQVPLPSYPFERKPYNPARRTQPKALAGLHPLLDRALPSQDGFVFRTNFSARNVFLRDHVVNGRPILPGACQIEMACAAAAAIRGRGFPISLQAISFLRPIALSGSDLEIQTELHAEGDNYRFRNFSIDAPAHSYTEGAISFPNDTPLRSRIDLPALKLRLQPAEDVARIFSLFSQAGVVCGPYCRGMNGLWLGEREALAELRLPEDEIASAPLYTLHPTLLDGALQAAFALQSRQDGARNNLVVPFSIGRLEVLSPLSTPCFAYVKLTQDAKAEPPFQIALLSSEGELLAKISDFAVRALAAPVKTASPEPAMAVFTPHWSELEPAEPGVSSAHGVTLLVETPIDTGDKEDLICALHSPSILRLTLATETRSLGPGHFSLDWRHPEGFTSVLASTKKLSTVYFLARQSSVINIFEPAAVAKIVEETTLGLWLLLKALSQSSLYTASSPLTVKVVTCGIFAVMPGDAIQPAASTLPGLCRAAAREYPQLRILLLDTDTISNEAFLQQFEEASGSTLALRAERRFTLKLSQVALPNSTHIAKAPIRHGGLYLIVGGAGGLGRAFASWLASQFAAHVVLIGRSAPSAQLNQQLSETGSHEGRIEYRQGDVSDFDQMKLILADLRRRHQRIDGIIHAALVLRDSSLDRMDEEKFRAVLLPKVAGSLVLGSLLREEPPDFIAFFSSANSHFGNAGQANYAAASTFQDALGLALRQHGLPIKIINWGFWGEVGAVATPFYRDRVQRLGVGSISTPEGIDTFAAILQSPFDQVMPMKVSPATLTAMGLSVTPEANGANDEISRAFEQVESYGRHLLRRRVGRPSAMKVVPKFDRLKQTLEAMFERAGITDIGDAELSSRLTELTLDRDRIVHRHPWIGPFFRLLDACIERYPEVLSGDTPAAQVLFPNSSLALVEPLYRGNPIVDRYNSIVAEAVARVTSELSGQGHPIRILEVGAGTGGTSAGVLAALEPYKHLVSYEYTDLSPAFILHAERTFKPRYPFLRANVLDIERDPGQQNFEPASFDLILATNVIHATRNIHRSAKNLRLLLKDGGLLILNEATRVQDFSTITFGLTDGWWLFEDAELRLPGSPLLSRDSWQQVLEANRFHWNAVESGSAEDAQMVFSAKAVALAEEPFSREVDAPAEASPSVPAYTVSDTITSNGELEYVTSILREQVGRAIRLSPSEINLRKRFAEYGVDSILSLDLLRRIGEAFQLNLRATLLFDYPCIADLALHLCSEHSGNIAAVRDIKQPAPAVVDAGALFEQQPAPSIAPPAAAEMPIAVVGMAGRFPGARNTRQFWSNLRDGVCSITEVPASRWDVHEYYDPDPAKPGKSPCKWGGFIDGIDQFDPLFFSMSGAESEYTDPQQRLFLQEAWSAFEDAGYSPAFLDGRACGLFVGVGAGDYIHEMYEQRLEPNPYAFLGNGASVLASRISYLLNLKGPALAIDTACSSSLVAVHLACQSIARGECEMALAGGVFLSIAPGFHYLTGRLGMLSPTGQVHAFDDAADGFVPGEGVGAIVLRPLADALRDRDHIYGVIRATGTNQDGHTNGITSPSAKSQASLQSDLYRSAGIDPTTISMVEAHGTGTPLGDPIEVEALQQSFAAGQNTTASIALGSVKTNIGHAGPAAGIAGLVKALLSLHHGQIPPSLHYTKPNRHIDFASSPFFVNDKLREWKASPGHPRRAVVSAFGLSGTNAHALVEEAPPIAKSIPPSDPQTVLLSAQTSSQLQTRIHDLSAWLETPEGSGASLADIACTLSTGRMHLPVRAAFAANTTADLADQLRNHLRGIRTTASPVSALASRYLQGEEIDWSAISSMGHRTSMPAYPFGEDRFWLPKTSRPSVTSTQTSVKLFKPAWRTTPPVPRRTEYSPVLLIAEGHELARALELASGPGLVQQLAAFPSNAIALAQSIELFEAVVYLHDTADTSPLFQLAAALRELSSNRPRHILILEPADSGAAGAFTRSIRMLRGDVRWSSLHTANPVEDANIIWQTLLAHSNRDEWRTHGSNLAERYYIAVTPPTKRGILRRGGVYWINGGTGAIGNILAKYLAERYHARVAVTGRRRLQAATDGALHLQADTTDREAMRQARNQIYNRFGELHGVFHLAGIIQPDLIHRKDEAAIRSVLDPKVRGASVLDEVTASDPLDFFAVFSSLSAVTGDFGQCDYSVANRLLEDVATNRSRLVANDVRQGRTVSIGWPLWKDGGMHFDRDKEQQYIAASGLAALNSDDAMSALELCLSSGETNLYVVQGDEARIEAIFNPAPIAAADSKKAPAPLPPPIAGASLSQSLREMVATLLKLPADRIALDANLSTLGVDSLNMKSLAETIQAAYGVSLSPSVFFESNTIAAVAAHLKPLISSPPHSSPAVTVPTSSEQRPEPFREANEPIAIIGMSGRFPQSNNLEEFWAHLVAGHDLITEIPADRWDWRDHQDIPRWGGFMPALDRFDAAFFGISPREAVFMDPQHRIFLETVWHTFEEAGYAPSAFAGRKVGVFVGCQFNEYMALAGDVQDANAQAALGSTRTMLPNRVSFLLDLRGPSEAVDTACSSALVALHRAVRSIQSGECEAAIAGGVSAILSHETYTLAHRLGMLAPDGRCKSFDSSANGYVKGEGVGAVLLKPLSRALADGDHIHAVIRSTAENHGGRANFLTAPNPEAQAQLLIDAWQRAVINPADLTYLEAHGTGTELGDPIEIDALRRAYAHFQIDSPRIAIGSVKSNIGHLEPAAGIAGLLKVVLALQHRFLPATLHVKHVNPYLNLGSSHLTLTTEARDWSTSNGMPRLSGVSSFGFGGSNAHAVLEEYPFTPSTPSHNRAHFIPISGKTEDRLRASITDLCNALAASTHNWDDLVFTLQTGREAMNHRLVVAASTPAELVTTLRRWLAGDDVSGAVWQGVASEGAAHQLFDSADELEAFVQDRIRQGKLSSIVRLWTQGLAIPWQLIHGGTAPRRVPLPVYPFERTRHWFDSPQRPTKSPSKTVSEQLSEAEQSIPTQERTTVLPPEASTTPIEPILREQLRELFASALYMTADAIDDDASFADLGLDSILAVEIVKQINQLYALDLKATRLYDYSNLKDLSLYISQCGPTLAADPATQPSASLAAVPERSSSPHLQCVKQLLAEALSLNAADVPDCTDLLELGLDLVSAASLSASLQQEFSITLTAGRLLEFASAEALANEVLLAPVSSQARPPAQEPALSSPPKPVASNAPPTEHMEIAIIGMSGRFPGADNLAEYWHNLRNGIDSVSEPPAGRWPRSSDPRQLFRGGFLKSVDLFDPLFFNISPSEADRIEPQQRLFLEEAWKALEDAGYSEAAIAEKQCALFVGVAPGDYTHNTADDATLSPAGNANSILAARLAYLLDLKGPAVSLDTACSSALVATHLACQGLARGEYELAIAGGISIFTSPTTHVLTSQMQMLSPDGKCKTFDDSADGFVPAEGVGVVILKPLARALQDRDQIYAVIRGSGINQDGRTNGILAPSALSQSQLQREVYRRYGIQPAAISCVEAHGTGTKLGDPIEIEAITNAFSAGGASPQSCAIGSVKTNIGHSLPAAGIAGLIKLALALRHQEIPPSLHCTHENEHIHFATTPFFVNRTLRSWPHSSSSPRLAAINSFGMSGTNAHMVLEQAPLSTATPDSRPAWLFTLSAKTSEARQARIADLASLLRETGDSIPLGDLSYTLNACRTHFRWRAAFVASSHAELLDQLQQTPSPRHLSRAAAAKLGPQNASLQSDPGELATSYLAGHDIDFGPLYSSAAFRKLSLPAYPFARRRHWLSESKTQPHPLIDDVQSLLTQHVARKHFTLKDEIVAHHQVGSQHLLPGVAVIEMARAAAAAIEPGRSVTGMRHLIWRTPVIVDEQGIICSLTLTPSAKDAIPFALSDTSAKFFSDGELLFAAQSSPAGLDIAAIQQRCPDLVSSYAIYQRLRQMGVHHGPTFQHLESVAVGKDELLATLHFTLPLAALRAMPLHPGLLDSALHSLAGFSSSEHAPSGPMLPFALDSIRFHAPLASPCFVHARVIPTSGNDEARFDLTIADSSGNVLVELQDFRVRSPRNPPPAESPAGAEAKLLTFRPTWNATASKSPAADAAGNILIFHREGELALARALAAQHGASSTLITLNARFDQLPNGSFYVDYHSSVDFDRVFEAIPPSRVYFLGALAATKSEAVSLDPEIIDQAQETGVWALLRLCRALALLPTSPTPPTLVVVTAGVNHVLASDQLQPAAASCIGFARAAAREYSNLHIITVDLESEFQPDQAAPLLAAESTPSIEIAVRGDRRFEQALEPIALSTPSVEGLPFRQQGVYIILGGAGGLGREFARHLAARYKVRLVLVGRSEWNQELQVFLDELNQLGGSALYAQADATSPPEIHRVIAETTERWGFIHGVIHSAFVLSDSLLDNMEDETFRKTLDSKVRTTSVLVSALSGMSLDWLAIFSSSVSFTVNAGQANYTAGSRFQDAFALAAQRALPCPVRIVNWGFWGHTGSVATQAHRERAAALGVFSIATEEGVALLEQVLLSSEPQIVALKLSESTLSGAGLESIPKPQTSEATSPPSTPSAPDLHHYLSLILQETLRLQPQDLEEDRTFDQFGIDSLISLEIVQRLERDFGSLPRTLLFDHPDLQQLDRYLTSNYPTQVARLTAAPNEPPVSVAPDHSATLVPIRSSGSAPASFWVHSLMGEISWVLRLAHHLGNDFPVYAFQAGNSDAAPSFSTFQELASAYVAALRTVQRHGPYVLGGYSLGGAIAFEMAQQLHAAGESISSLILIDSYAPNSNATRSFSELSWDGFMVLMLTNTLIAQWGGREPLHAEALPPNDPNAQIKVAAQHLRATTNTSQSLDDLESLLHRSLESSLANASLFESYLASPFPVALEALLLRNSKGFVSTSNPYAIPAVAIDESQPDHGWSRWLQAPPRIVSIDADHLSLGQEPAIRQIAQEVAKVLTQPPAKNTRTQIFAVVKEHVLRVLDGVPPQRITLETSLREIGANSIDRVEIAIGSMEQLHLNVSRTELSTVQDLRGLVELFEAHTA